MRAYVDPETGAFTGAPPGAGGEAAPAEHAGEAVKEQALPGGGVIVHVPTRLKKPLVARIGCDGRPHIAHEAAADQPTARSSRE
jgi:hypothetical protein